MTVCGLATINLSSLTGFQQSILFMLMCIGNPVIVSWVIVYMRRYFFAKKFEGILEAVAAQKATRLVETARKQHRPWPHRFIAFLQGRHISVEDEDQVEEGAKKGDGNAIRKLRPDMIRRMDDAPKLVNPSGWVSEGRAPSIRKGSVSSTRLQLKTISSPSDPNSDSDGDRADSQNRDIVIDFVEPPRRPRRLSDPGHPSRPNSPTSTKMHRFETVADAAPSPSGSPKRFPRTQTVEFAPPPKRPARLGQTIPENSTIREEPQGIVSTEPRASRHFFHTSTMPQSLNTYPTSHSHHSIHSHHTIHPATSLTRDFGGFPSLFSIIKQIVKRLFPTLERKLTRTVTIPATVSLTPGLPGSEPGKKQVPYITFEAVVGRNSAFHLLTSEQLDEIGGVEYRALNALLWIVPLYHFGIQLIAFTVIAPYISAHRWDSIFNEQIRPLNRIWYSAFQVVSAYTNTGTSLVDESMVPFQTAYPMIFMLIILILAGNTAFVTCLSKKNNISMLIDGKCMASRPRMHETLHFLLDHPRRCFIYLFPSHQTWFLLTIVLGLTSIDWFFFLILDLHNPAIDSIPVGVRVLAGVMQAAAVRAAGFAIVPLAALAPAVKVLYVVMMYISVYPIAMSVRSTNVYEEQSLGVFNPLDHDIEDEQDFVASGPRMNVWSRYLAMHARKQLAFVFELVSAYGTVGLSLGIPDQNYSFVGAMHTLSKLIICIVMIRGRHRGLPVAIDRAIMLPSEFKKNKDDDDKNITNVDSSTDSRPFVYSETMNSRVPPDMRQRTRRGSRKWSVGSGQMGNKNDDEGEGTAHIPDHDSNKRSS
uniref:Potassium transport protein n=1 Tax=Psilocybe cubensis TaxID=181762 RepID=A0A8H7Y882_PSICU